jgi:DNA-binding winged helix-turn-helix (wHTH) protein
MAERYLIAGPIRLDLHDARVWRDQTPVRLGGKAFALLHALMDNPQMLVTKDALFERVWNGLAVSDSVLTTAVKELRQALGDDAREPVFVETVHRRGYRFLLPVEADDADARQPAKIEAPVSAPEARSLSLCSGSSFRCKGVIRSQQLAKPSPIPSRLP